MDTTRIPPAGDPFTAKVPKAADERRLVVLEDRLAHEFMDDAERQELRDLIIALRRNLSR